MSTPRLRLYPHGHHGPTTDWYLSAFHVRNWEAAGLIEFCADCTTAGTPPVDVFHVAAGVGWCPGCHAPVRFDNADQALAVCPACNPFPVRAQGGPLS